MTPRQSAWLVTAGLILPGIARAHSPIEGFSDFYNGLLHPVFVPAHALLLVALGFWWGQQELRDSQAALAGFFLAAVAGLVAGPLFTSGIELLQLVCALVIALLVAGSVRLRKPWRVASGALAGLVIALDSAPGDLAGTPRLLALLGTAIGMHLLLVYAMGVADFLKKRPWQRIGIRVLGSWIAASSILVIALSLSPKVS